MIDYESARVKLIKPSPAITISTKAMKTAGAFYVFPRKAGFIDKTAPDGQVIENDTDLTGYILQAGKVAGIQGAAFGLSPYIRFSYAAFQEELKAALDQITTVLGVLK